ncbi:MAG: hypothetical protein R3C68_08800 [Myxococcota bacterium]
MKTTAILSSRKTCLSRASAAVLTVILLVAPAMVQAAPNWIIEKNESRGRQHLDLVLGFDFDVDTLVPGIWYGIPVLPSGLVPINDSFDIEVGGFVGLGDVNYVLPAAGPRWSFHFLPTWDMFLTLKLAYLLVDGPGDDLRIGGSLGGDWFFSERMGLRIESSSFGRRTSFLTAGLVLGL